MVNSSLENVSSKWAMDLVRRYSILTLIRFHQNGNVLEPKKEEEAQNPRLGWSREEALIAGAAPYPCNAYGGHLDGMVNPSSCLLIS